jgi:hypothetical protein
MKSFTDYLDEIRKPSAEDEHEADQGQHIVMQLRKSVTMNGQKHVKFNDGKTHQVSRANASKFLSKHQGMKTSHEKRKLQATAAKSHDHFHSTIKDHYETPDAVADHLSHLMKHETKEAPAGTYFTKAGQLKKGDPASDGPGGAKLASDPLDKQRKTIVNLKNHPSKESVGEEHDPKHVKQAIGIASDPRYKQGNMTGAVNAMNKLSKDIHKHPQVAAVLRRQNESKVNEISKGTLTSYIKKAGQDKSRKWGQRDLGKRTSDDAYANQVKRNKGIDMAKSKMKPSKIMDNYVNKLSELSKDTLGKYVKKAVKNVDDRSFAAGITDAQPGHRTAKNHAKIRNRITGIDRAVDKMTKEDMSGMSQKSGDKRSTESGAGMTAQGVAKYNRRTGGDLKTAVTTPPSKLKAGSKAAGRRKSFCARSSGWTGERGKAARRRWNC